MRRGGPVLLGGAIAVVIGLAALRFWTADDGDLSTAPPSTLTSAPSTTTVPATPTTTITPPFDGWVDPRSSGQPFGQVPGLLTFRGNPTRSYYGQGPVPSNPQVQWSFPESAMCSLSSVGDETKQWCGTGWTGQPSVFERDGQTWVAFGAYDRAVHWLDAASGARLRDDLVTGDLIKGSVSVDPDGFPLTYVGSRDNRLRVIAFDRNPPVELWSLDAYDVSPTLWNDDWDGSPLVLDDYLFEGGENSQLHIVKLNRSTGPDGLAQVAPELVFNAPGWDDELLDALGDFHVSIENSVALSGNTLYFSNSGGLVQGWDLTGLALGTPPERVFRYWTGDDTDATVVIDDEGMLYVASEYERSNARSEEVGQIIKLDPSRPDAPLLWSVADRGTNPAGVWATPAIHRSVLLVATNAGEIKALDRETGEQLWSMRLPGPTWQSPVVVDDVLIQGDCAGVLHGYDVSRPRRLPPGLWQVTIGGCIESTPAVWDGQIFVGTRAGLFHALGDPPTG